MQSCTIVLFHPCWTIHLPILNLNNNFFLHYCSGVFVIGLLVFYSLQPLHGIDILLLKCSNIFFFFSILYCACLMCTYMAAFPGPPLGSSRKMDGGQPPSTEEEPPKDPGLAKHHSYTIEDLEGHHAHSIYTGIHIPGAYRRRSRHRHHRHHHHHKSSKDGTENRPGEF